MADHTGELPTDPALEAQIESALAPSAAAPPPMPAALGAAVRRRRAVRRLRHTAAGACAFGAVIALWHLSTRPLAPTAPSAPPQLIAAAPAPAIPLPPLMLDTGLAVTIHVRVGQSIDSAAVMRLTGP